VGNAIRNRKGRIQNKVKETKYFIFRRKQMVKYPTTKFLLVLFKLLLSNDLERDSYGSFLICKVKKTKQF